MHGWISWLARNPVAANLLMVLLVVSGLLAITGIRGEVFPEVPLDEVSIQVTYLGAGPEEVESAVVTRIEEAVEGIEGVGGIRATATEGSARVVVELAAGADASRATDEITNRVEAIETFPAEVERPIVRELIARNQVVDVAVSGAVDLVVLRTQAERVRDDLARLPGISLVEIVAAPPYEISIEVSEEALRRHGLTFDDVANAVQRSSLDLPGGSVRTDYGEFLLRTEGQAYRGNEYEDLTLWTRSDGSRLRLGDVATVVDGFADTDLRTRFDRTPQRSWCRSSGPATRASSISPPPSVAMSTALGARLPEGVSLAIWRDEGRGPERPALSPARQRRHRIPAGVRPADTLPQSAACDLGQPGDSDRLPGRHRADAQSWRVDQHRVDIRVHPGARDRGRRRDHRRREHPRCLTIPATQRVPLPHNSCYPRMGDLDRHGRARRRPCPSHASLRLCSPPSRRIATLCPRSAGLTALTAAPRRRAPIPGRQGLNMTSTSGSLPLPAEDHR